MSVEVAVEGILPVPYRLRRVLACRDRRLRSALMSGLRASSCRLLCRHAFERFPESEQLGNGLGSRASTTLTPTRARRVTRHLRDARKSLLQRARGRRRSGAPGQLRTALSGLELRAEVAPTRSENAHPRRAMPKQYVSVMNISRSQSITRGAVCARWKALVRGNPQEINCYADSPGSVPAPRDAAS